LLAKNGYVDEIADVATAGRLREERQRQIGQETDPLRRIGYLLESAMVRPSEGEQIAAAIGAADFPVGDQHAAWSVTRAFERYPEQVAAALTRRLEAGRELPFRAEELVADVAPVDDGPIAAAAIDPGPSTRTGMIAASLVGPRTVGRMIDALVAMGETLAAAPPGGNSGSWDKYHELMRRISRTGRPRLPRPCLERPAPPHCWSFGSWHS
jgi:hypothetical protein